MQPATGGQTQSLTRRDRVPVGWHLWPALLSVKSRYEGYQNAESYRQLSASNWWLVEIAVANRGEHVSGLSLFGYSTVLPIVWLSLGVLLDTIHRGARAGIGGLFFVVLIVVTFTSWLFVRKHRRHFSNREFWILIAFCSMWAAVLESAGLVYAASVGLIDISRTRALTFAVLFAFAVDTTFLFLGFKFTGRRFIDHYLDKHPE